MQRRGRGHGSVALCFNSPELGTEHHNLLRASLPAITSLEHLLQRKTEATACTSATTSTAALTIATRTVAFLRRGCGEHGFAYFPCQGALRATELHRPLLHRALERCHLAPQGLALFAGLRSVSLRIIRRIGIYRIAPAASLAPTFGVALAAAVAEAVAAAAVAVASAASGGRGG